MPGTVSLGTRPVNTTLSRFRLARLALKSGQLGAVRDEEEPDVCPSFIPEHLRGLEDGVQPARHPDRSDIGAGEQILGATLLPPLILLS